MPPASRRRAPSAPADRPPEEDPQLEEHEGEEGSGGSSTGSSDAASDFISDPGPAFDADQAEKDAQARDGDRAFAISPGGETGVELEWHPDTIKAVLEAKGSALHSLAGKAEADWAYTSQELRAIAPPLTRILNRYDATRVAAGGGDELALILGFTGYTMRSFQERKQALDAKRAQEEQEEPPADPLMSGVQPPPFEPGPGPGAAVNQEPIQ